MEQTSFNSFIAYVTEIVDADTFDVEIELGFNITFKTRIRVEGFDAPETWRPDTKEELEHGKEATQRAKKLLENKKVTLITNQITGYYGRYLADVYIDNIDYSEIMINENYSKRDVYEEKET